MKVPYGAKFVTDQYGQPVLLFQSQWDADYAQRENPKVKLEAVRIMDNSAEAAFSAANPT